MNGYYSYIRTDDTYLDSIEHATYKGIVIKTVILLAITIAVGVLTAFFLPQWINSDSHGFLGVLIGATIAGFVSVIIGRLSDRMAMICSFIYSICEGLVLGALTAIIDLAYPGTGTLAVTGTVIVFTVMLILYAFGFIRNGSMVRMIAFGIIASVLALVIFDGIFVLFTGGADFGISFVIQALLLAYGVITLTFNFAEAEAVVKMGASKDAEWSVALGMEVSLVYIYIYVLKLTLYLVSRR